MLISHSAPPTGINYYLSREDSVLSTVFSMLDILFRYTDLNPFDYWPDKVDQVMSIQCGLPPEIIKYLLHHKAHGQVELERFHSFVLGKLLESAFQTKAERQGLSLLLMDYERINTGLENELVYWIDPLLQIMVQYWITTEYLSGINSNIKNIV
jgi:hypothetical protein